MKNESKKYTSHVYQVKHDYSNTDIHEINSASRDDGYSLFMRILCTIRVCVYVIHVSQHVNMKCPLLHQTMVTADNFVNRQISNIIIDIIPSWQ